MKYCLRFVVFILFLMTGAPVYSFDIEMTDAEWMTWPEYCKIRYAQLGAGKNPKFSKYASSSKQDKWIRILGWENYRGVQHFCTGRIWLQRAAIAESAKKKSWAYERATSEFSFSYYKGNSDAPYYSELSSYLARALYKSGEKKKAYDILDHALTVKPEQPFAYTEKAKFLRYENETKKAVEVLQLGLENVGKHSMNIHVFLAHAYYDLDDYKRAKYHSDQAYSHGYTIPGLKQKVDGMKSAQ